MAILGLVDLPIDRPLIARIQVIVSIDEVASILPIMVYALSLNLIVRCDDLL
jgi:hypothetical protein